MNANKILLAGGTLLIVLITWALCVTLSPRRQAEQGNLVQQANSYITDQIYVKAIPLLEEALAIHMRDNSHIVLSLAGCYRALDDQRGYRETLQAAADAQMPNAEIYRLLATEYLATSLYYQEALTTLQDGYRLTGDASLNALYEEKRYAYRKSYNSYEALGIPVNGTIPAMQKGKWGYIDYSGEPVIPFHFDKATSFYGVNAMAVDGGQAVLIDQQGRRLAVCRTEMPVMEVMPLRDGLSAIMLGDTWHLADATLATGSKSWQFVGPTVNGTRAACVDGKWSLQTGGGEALTPDLEGLALDTEGVAYRRERFFAKAGETYTLIDGTGTAISQERYDDARPFRDGYAAVKKDGLWGFVEVDGTQVLPMTYSDAFSFSGGLAAVKRGALWGYITADGREVIPCQFAGAIPFAGGVAAVQTESGWSTIKLREILD